MISEANYAVWRGASYLDAHCPDPNWRDLIELDSLNMLLAHSCILGQIYNKLEGTDYLGGVESLGLNSDSAVYYGFNNSPKFTASELENAWRELLVDEKADMNKEDYKIYVVIKSALERETHDVVMATYSEEKAKGAIMALRSIGHKVRMDEVGVV